MANHISPCFISAHFTLLQIDSLYITLYCPPTLQSFILTHSHPQNVWDGHFNKLHTARNAVLNSRFKFDID